MASAVTKVDFSHDVHTAALNLNAKANELRPTLAGIWNLNPVADTPPAEAHSLNAKNEGEESVIDSDGRTLVDPQHFAPGGKYRSIVKLFIHFEFQEPEKWMMGTGWLIRPDLFVTAGHCSYDWAHHLGRATEVKAYIGYHGKGSATKPDVQFRHVKKIVSTDGWLTQKGLKPFDVSFMQVDKAFTGIQPIKFEHTPSSGSCNLGVVGYPGDLKDEKSNEHGAHMYEMWLPTQFDLTKNGDTMLEYLIDTFGGNSGSPVFRQHDMVSLGAHVYGGSSNTASVIGKYGNPYEDYIKAIGIHVPDGGLHMVNVETALASGGVHTDAPNTTVSIMPVKSTQKPAPRQTAVRRRIPVKPSTNGPPAESSEEGFFDFLKSAVRIAAPIAGKVAGTVLPMALGPVGGPIGALAGAALNAAGRACESVEAGEDPKAQHVHEGTAERAVLAEATLQALLDHPLPDHLQEGIFSDMKDVVMKALPKVKQVAPKVLGAMMEPALKMALDSLHTYNTPGAESSEADEPFHNHTVYSTRIDAPTEPHKQAFITHLQKAQTRQAGPESAESGEQEGIFDVISAGIKIGGGILGSFGGFGEGIEAESVEVGGPAGPSAEVTKHLANRALAAEAALQAVLKAPHHHLEAEGFFDSVFSVVKKVAPIVLKNAPAVLGAVSPMAGKIAQVGLGMLGGGPQEGYEAPAAAPSAPAPPLRPKQSMSNLIEKKIAMFA